MAGSSPGGSPAEFEADAFISHSSRDKRRFVRPLVECITDHGVHVWYDEYSMQPGDSLSASIDRGLTTASQGVVVISPSFIETALQSGWTHYELRGIVANSVGGAHRRIVPVWLDVTANEVRQWSPPLADLLAIDASTKPIEAVALEILQVIAPSKAGGLQRQRLLQMLNTKGQSAHVDPRYLNQSPIVERRIAGSVPLRALLVTQTLADCGEPAASDYVGFLENLARDLHHETELRLWEAIAGSFSLACSTYDLDSAQRHALYTILMLATFGQSNPAAVKLLTADVAAPVLDHFQSLLSLVHSEAVIGKGGLRAPLAPSKPNEDEDASPAMGRVPEAPA